MEMTPESKVSVGLIGLKPETDGISAIKALRSALGLSLKEAKAKYDAIKEGKSCIIELSPEAAATHIPLMDAHFFMREYQGTFFAAVRDWLVLFVKTWNDFNAGAVLAVMRQ